MKYYSTNKNAPEVDFREASINGLAPDRGLYFPSSIPKVDPYLIENIKSYSNLDLAFNIIKPYVGTAIPDNELLRILAETISFEIPLVTINERISSLELYHGPTFAFKDVGARFMSRCLGYFAEGISTKMTVLVATSGDTGGAVANGFYNVPGVDVVILYPSGRVSDIQEKQLTTLGGNVTALEVLGTFDDCQKMVKEAFADTTLRSKLFLTSANSINVARWIPQQLFYFFAAKQWEDDFAPAVAVPSGNFGNICSGLLAKKSGLPLGKFIAACNANQAVPSYLKTGKYIPQPTISTISNAMDVGNPSNFVRIIELYKSSYQDICNDIVGYSISDSETKSTIEATFKKFGYWLDPHGAVAFAALESYLAEHKDEKGILLETAHPIKFDCETTASGAITDSIAQNVEMLRKKEKKSLLVKSSYNELKDYLLQ